MKLNNKLYNILKWLALIAINAFGNAYEQLAKIWDLPYGTEIMRTCSILSVLIGTLIGLSTYSYHKENVGEGLEIIEDLTNENKVQVVEFEEDNNDKDV